LLGASVPHFDAGFVDKHGGSSPSWLRSLLWGVILQLPQLSGHAGDQTTPWCEANGPTINNEVRALLQGKRLSSATNLHFWYGEIDGSQSIDVEDMVYDGSVGEVIVCGAVPHCCDRPFGLMLEGRLMCDVGGTGGC
jgi:hypothetical protein